MTNVEPKQYVFTARATFNGVTGTVTATSLGEARLKAEAGNWDDGVDTGPAEIVDWKITSVTP